MHIKEQRKGISYVLDNGAYYAKIGRSDSSVPALVPNCIMKVKSERRRPFIGDQIEECRDASGLFYILPFQRGYLVNWDIQKTVWDYTFSKDICTVKLNETPVCITEPIMNFQSAQEAMDEIFFEEYECCGLLRLNATDLSAYKYSHMNRGVQSCVVVDTGYSFTHIVPYINGKKYLPGIKRIDVGGKILTNHLKEVISYRQLHVMDETYVINQMKEDACYVSEEFIRDMRKTCHRDFSLNPIMRDYILPDYSTVKRGYLMSRDPDASMTEENGDVQGERQKIRLNNERIAIPEILFNPSDIGIPQKGIGGAIQECIEACPPKSKYQLLANIVVTGGNARFENFHKRVYSEVRQRFHEYIDVNVYTSPDPLTFAWEGGKELATSDNFYTFLVSKEEYEENGHMFSSTHLQQFRINA